ncbi:MAG: hypothetical protein H7317_06450 [Pseudorhodobacter sp.]|nr:hypothetical protein [Pseudorhodobacter sp.]
MLNRIIAALEIPRVKSEFKGLGITLTCEIDPGFSNDLIGDPTRLRPVLLNLLGNAIEFTQADSSTTRRIEARPHLCKRLVELMGGSIWVESSVDKGSTFGLIVPFEVGLGANRPVAAPIGAGPEVPLRSCPTVWTGWRRPRRCLRPTAQPPTSPPDHDQSPSHALPPDHPVKMVAEGPNPR